MADKNKNGPEDKQVIFLVGASHNGKNGERRTVDAATAERLVRQGAARYPASKGK
jgi:hypothetical protein